MISRINDPAKAFVMARAEDPVFTDTWAHNTAVTILTEAQRQQLDHNVVAYCLTRATLRGIAQDALANDTYQYISPSDRAPNGYYEYSRGPVDPRIHVLDKVKELASKLERNPESSADILTPQSYDEMRRAGEQAGRQYDEQRTFAQKVCGSLIERYRDTNGERVVRGALGDAVSIFYPTIPAAD